jgi:hypothetical protein
MPPLKTVLILLLLAAISTPLSAADASGKWTGQMVIGMDAKTIPFVMDLKLDGSTLTGTFCFRDCTGNKQPIQNAKIVGDVVSFSIVTDTSDVPQFDFQGTISGDEIKFIIIGNAEQCGGSSCQIGTASATRPKQ